ncbi:hypothetical protein BH10PSE17_BH10PSE17_31360 [soil metagenome]
MTLLTGATHAADSPGAARAARTELDFTALLDGSPIGHHRFTITNQGDERTVDSAAEFTVKILGITAFHYKHHAVERWRGDCIASMDSTTDDDGKPSKIHAEQDGEAFVVKGSKEAEPATGCVLTFAYWNPAVRSQTRLLNAQSGKIEAVEIKPVDGPAIDVKGRSVDVKGIRITGTKQPIEVWYGPDGDWIGLDSIVSGGRKLSYRLQ